MRIRKVHSAIPHSIHSKKKKLLEGKTWYLAKTPTNTSETWKTSLHFDTSKSIRDIERVPKLFDHHNKSCSNVISPRVLLILRQNVGFWEDELNVILELHWHFLYVEL